MADDPTPTPSSAGGTPPSNGGASAPSSSAPPPVDRLTSDYLPPAPKAAAEKPQPEPPPTPEPEPAPTPEPTPTAFKYRGRDYTLAQLEALLPSILTTAEQFPHLQTKYQEMLERFAQPPQPRGPEGPSLSPQQFQANLRAQIQPRLQQVIQNGWMEPDFAELYPNAAAQALYLTANLEDAIGRLVQLEQRVGGMGASTASKEARSVVDTALEAIAGQGALYDGLKDAGKRQEYLAWLAEKVNPVADWSNPEITRDVLGRQWLAFNAAAILEAAKQTTERAQQERDDAKRRAQGAGGGPRPGAPAPSAPSHLETLLEGVLPRR
jgi:hypothetical protein